MKCTLFKEGRRDYDPVSHIVFRGIYHEIRCGDLRFLTDLSGDIKWIFREGGGSIYEEGTLFRRTLGGRWIYYDSSLYGEAFDLAGRHYLPLSIDMPPISGLDRERQLLDAGLEAWNGLIQKGCLEACYRFRDTKGLMRRSIGLRHTIMGSVPVVPPEALFFDYDLIPVIVKEGCLANCGFCAIKGGADPKGRTLAEIRGTILGLRDWIGCDRVNYPLVFLGQNDALSCETGVLEEAANMAYEVLSIEDNYFSTSGLLLFGSPQSILEKGIQDFLRLDALPFTRIYINVGIESLHGPTISALGRPFDVMLSQKALKFIDEIHDATQKVAVSTNFLISLTFPQEHTKLLEDYLVGLEDGGKRGKVFLSPLFGQYESIGAIKREVFRLKARSLRPVYLYFLIPYA